MLFIIDADGRRLCQDGKWRDHADFGTFSDCVKEYQLFSAARKRATRVKGRVVYLPQGVVIDAVGNVCRRVPSLPGHERVEHPNIDEFVVWDSMLATD